MVYGDECIVLVELECVDRLRTTGRLMLLGYV